MASVRITQDLKTKIDRNICNAFIKQIERIENTLASDFGDRVYAYLYRKELEHIQALPENFFEINTRLTVKFYHFQHNPISYAIEFTQAKPVAQVHTARRNIAECHNSAIYDELNIMLTQKKAIENECSSLRNTVDRALNNTSTLKRFLEMLPEAEMFIPEDALRTHYEKTERKPRTIHEKVSVTLSDEQRRAIAKAKMSNL